MERKPGTVTQLSDYRAPKPPLNAIPQIELSDRQLAVREHLLDAADRPPDDAPAALVGLSVMPSGKINSVALQVEPEHVLPVLCAMRSLMTKLESYLTNSIANRYMLMAALAAGIETLDVLTVPALALTWIK